MKESLAKSGFAALSSALRQVEYWLSVDGISNLVIAAPSHKELLQQQLPAHLRVSSHKPRGRRVPLRGNRHFYETKLKMAAWPEDEMDENPLPFIFVVIRGQGDFRIGDYVLHCRTGDMVFVPAGVPKLNGNHSHFEGETTGRTCDVLWICTDVPKTEGLLCWICRSEGDVHRKEPGLGWCRVLHPFLSQLFLGFCAEAQKRRAPTIAAHLLQGVSLMLRDEIDGKRALDGWLEPHRYVDQGFYDPITEALAFMEEDLTRNITVENVARQISVSPATLTRRFKERTGKTFHEYHTDLRMERAEMLLLTTELPVAFISARVGLKYGQLRSLFQQIHRVSPGEFRSRKR